MFLLWFQIFFYFIVSHTASNYSPKCHNKNRKETKQIKRKIWSYYWKIAILQMKTIFEPQEKNVIGPMADLSRHFRRALAVGATLEGSIPNVGILSIIQIFNSSFPFKFRASLDQIEAYCINYPDEQNPVNLPVITRCCDFSALSFLDNCEKMF